ncbi:hypothetical protein GCM10009541_49790 [Micromonospora gifhornensis]|uniref:Barstar (Barnase inhibitor) n=1 Tax=Micromonospora gifhornensis TaxID=84594 RepID=A0ABQ4IKP1_9ACTN|nr:hypothetical protein [Micromonospora gifhornensis]GIJ18481.1 hypothetical protein Vgi01_51650 [Micromonospora gifhornensis]
MGDRRRPQLVHAQLVIDVSGDGGRSDRVIRDWFESGWRRLGHELRETADAQAVGASLPEVLCPFGVEVCLERVTEGGGDDSESDAYTPQEWQRFLGDLNSGVFKAYSLNASEREWVDEFNTAVAGGDWIVRQLSISVDRYEVDGRTLALLGVSAPRDFLLADSGREDGLYRFFRDAAEQAGPLFGLIGFDYGIEYMTGLEYALYLIRGGRFGRSMRCCGGIPG